ERATTPPPQKTCRPSGCAEMGLGLRCSVGRVSLRIHSLPRASPQANLSATNVSLFRRHHTSRYDAIKNRSATVSVAALGVPPRAWAARATRLYGAESCLP